MKNFLTKIPLLAILFLFIFTIQSCEHKEKKQSKAIEKKQITKDSTSSNTQEESNSPSIVTTENDTTEISEGRLSGKHYLTLQWISWTKPGEITFTSIGNNKYEVDGFQKGSQSDKCPECYLKIKGTIIEIAPKKLRFTGKIESSIYHIQAGKPCIKEGTFDFVSTKNRKYWRCRNMNGCDGVTDYVDIYF